MSVSAQRLSEIRKKNDEKAQMMDAVMKQEKKTWLLANFETTTCQKIDRRLRTEQYELLKRDEDVDLYKRRKELAEMYNQEIEYWKTAVLNKVESVEDRKARIKEKAFALKNHREKERELYIKKCMDAQWRDACDDARTLDSKAMTKFMGDERIRQIQERKERNLNINDADEKFYQEYKKVQDALSAKEQRKIDMAHAAALANQDALGKQIEHNFSKKLDHFNRSRVEDENEISDIRKAIQDEQDEIAWKKEEEIRRGKEVLAFNAQYNGIRAAEKAIEEEQDAILLDYALRKERKQIAFEEGKKHAAKMAALKFKKYLEEQMTKEADDNQWVDEIRKKEEEKVWKARDDLYQAREDARDALMKQVDAGRKEQIKAKYEQEKSEKEHDKVYVKKFIEDAKAGIFKEKEDMQKRRVVAMENSVKLMNQIDLREHARLLDQQDTFLEAKRMEYIERQHQLKLQEQGGSVRLFRPLKESQWYT